jgi:hypothetical protein
MTATRSTSALESFSHPELYRDPPEYLAGTIPFIREGIASGQPVAVAVPVPTWICCVRNLACRPARCGCWT